jgi:hypothetical protein
MQNARLALLVNARIKQAPAEAQASADTVKEGLVKSQPAMQNARLALLVNARIKQASAEAQVNADTVAGELVIKHPVQENASIVMLMGYVRIALQIAEIAENVAVERV